MKTLSLVGLLLSAALTVPAFAAEPAYKIVDRIKVPDGGFDYATFDAAKGRILMARTDFTTVIDTKTGKLSQLMSAARGHMALPIPGTTLLLLPQRQGTIRIADGKVPGPESSIEKVFWSEFDKRFRETALDILGPGGQLVRTSAAARGDVDWAREFLWSRAGTIYSGSSEVQRNIIAKRVLNLPQEGR